MVRSQSGHDSNARLLATPDEYGRCVVEIPKHNRAPGDAFTVT